MSDEPSDPRSPLRALRRYVRRYGWRAYALPALSVLTVLALVTMTGRTHRAPAAAPTPITAHPTSGPSTPSPTTASTPPSPKPAAIVQISGQPDSTACLTNSHSTYVLVSISQQHAWMCQGRVQVNSTPVTTGETINDDATPTGSWVVQGKQTNRYLVGPGYRDFVKFWIPFNGDFGFHDASWQTFPFGSAQYRTQGSHGCVHLPLAVVTWLYGWAQVNSTVVTIED